MDNINNNVFTNLNKVDYKNKDYSYNNKYMNFNNQYSEDKIRSIFGGKNFQKGIIPNLDRRNIVLISNYKTLGVKDYWNDDGTFMYCGESSEQTKGNRAILEAKKMELMFICLLERVPKIFICKEDMNMIICFIKKMKNTKIKYYFLN